MKKTIKHKALIINILLVVAMAMMVTGAWYVINSGRKVESEKTDVMTPYFLYLLNPDDEKSLSVSIGNIHPGEVKQIVIAVSSKNEDIDLSYDIAKDSDFEYQLELAYTENLPIDYRVYELEKDDAGDVTVDDNYGNSIMKFSKLSDTALTSVDVSEARWEDMYGSDREGIVNLGRYELFEKGSNGSAMQLLSIVEDNGDVIYDMDYYLIEIVWDSDDFSAYSKETDLVYIIVKALQPRPTEK